MSRFRTLIPLICILMAAFLPTADARGETSLKLPDFAYPKTVEADATKALAQADAAAGDSGPTRLRALLELCAAQQTIDANSTFSQPALIAQQLAKPGLSNASKAMLLSLEANILDKIYSRESYKYNRVTAPLEPYPADISEWSGEQFRSRVMALLDSAAVLADATPLSVFAASIEYSPEALTYLPTVSDFIRYRRALMCSDFARYKQPEYTALKKQICEEGIKTSKTASAPFFYWSVELALIPQMDFHKCYDTLNELYSTYDSVEAARYVLAAICDKSIVASLLNPNSPLTDFRRNEALAKAIKTSLASFPKWYDNASLSNKLADITRARASAKVPRMVAPGVPFDVVVSYCYAKSVKINMYKVADNTYVRSAKLAGMTPAASVTVTPDKAFGSATSSMMLNTPGTYAIQVSADGNTSGSMITNVYVAPILGIAVNGCKQGAAIAVDFITGAPLKDVTVNSVRRYQKSTPKALGRTDAKGILTIPTLPGSYDNCLTFRYKGINYTFDNNVKLDTFRPVNDSTTKYNVVILTDRALYHPGETIEWAVVAGAKMPRAAKGSILTDKELTVKLFDANGEQVDTCKVTTDALGRAYGSFTTKKGTLTGSYSIRAIYLDNTFYQNITVSDFKAPVFEVIVDSVKRDAPTQGAVTLIGTARTYSGMPVADATVNVTVNGAQRWRWFAPATELGTVETTTDSEGHFTAVIPANILKFDEYNNPYTDFVATVDVTTTTAETASSRRTFTTGKPYTLDINRNEGYVNIDRPFSLLVEAYDANGAKGTIAYTWQLTDSKHTKGLPSGVARTGEAVNLDLAALPIGKYTFKIAAADTTLANAIELQELSFYSIRRNEAPESIEGIFLPEKTVEVDGHSTKVLVGTNAEKLYIYAIVRDYDTLRPIKLSEIKRGFSTVKIELPDSIEKTEVRLVAALDGSVYVQTVNLRRAKSETTEFRAESFRDKLTPGAKETWRFRLATGKEGLADAGVIATMYNKALDALETGSWAHKYAFAFYTPNYLISLNYPYGGSCTASFSEPVRYADTYNMQWPEYMFSSQAPWGNARVTMKSMARANYASGSLPTQDLLIVEDAKEEAAEFDMTEADPLIVPAYGVIEKDEEPNDAEYREAEVLQAFWKPSLITDADGNVDIVFTVPNANATWQLKTFGWNSRLETATYMATALANRPVMVQPNLPRFLRQGDKATVLATVYNNSDETQAVTSTVEIFDIESGKVIDTVLQSDTIAAMASATVAMNLSAPLDAAAIGYRIRTSTGEYSDGEQSAIPVLSSAATVVESTEFYLNAEDSKPFEFTVKTPADATVTLQYCQNPIWTIVKAMRGIAAGESLTASGIVSHLFSAMAAKHITTTNPNIAKAIKEWSDNPDEEALTSMLERNADLKLLMLDQTPWVQAAKSNTSRMAALAQLLDPEAADKAIADGITRLSAMQNADGGFRWGSWSNESSAWTTENVLITLGIAHSLGIPVASVDAMARKAFAYLQAEACKPKRPATDRSLALVAAYFPDFRQSVAASKIVRATVADIAANWKKDATIDKAYDIIILKANARPAEAATVLESVRQFAVDKPGTGLCFPNVSDMRSYATILQAYTLMGAPKAEIDAMRQWVTVQAQALDDLGAVNPDYIVAAMLFTGSDWTSVPAQQSVSIDGKPLDIARQESAAGYFSQQLEPTGKKMTITVTPNGVTPSYGSVTSISKSPAATVKARPGKDLSIEKRFLAERDGVWVETDRFTTGERVRVQLTVKAKRNLEYVSITDERAASFAPVDQLPGFVWDGALGFYRENLDASTRLFISYLPQGTYHISYDMTAAVAGEFISGIATLQSQYAPELTAHSAGNIIMVE